jgi:hypothetical protein
LDGDIAMTYVINQSWRGTMGMCLELFLVLSLISNDDMWVGNVGGCPYCVCVFVNSHLQHPLYWRPQWRFPNMFSPRHGGEDSEVIHNDKHHPQVWGSLLALLLFGIMERDSQMVGEWYRFIIGFTTLPRNNFRTLQGQTRQCIFWFCSGRIIQIMSQQHPDYLFGCASHLVSEQSPCYIPVRLVD